MIQNKLNYTCVVTMPFHTNVWKPKTEHDTQSVVTLQQAKRQKITILITILFQLFLVRGISFWSWVETLAAS